MTNFSGAVGLTRAEVEAKSAIDAATRAKVEAKSAIDAATREMQQAIAKARILTSPTAQISPNIDIPAELIITKQKYNLAYERLEENTKLFNEAEQKYNLAYERLEAEQKYNTAYGVAQINSATMEKKKSGYGGNSDEPVVDEVKNGISRTLIIITLPIILLIVIIYTVLRGK